MSHFVVLVIGPDPEGQLDPYWELDLPDHEMREDYRAEFVTEIVAGDFKKKAREAIAAAKAGQPELAVKYRKLLAAGQAEQVLQEWFGGQKNEDGDWGYFANPQAKWDWNELGGRWQGSLQLLPGRTEAAAERFFETAPNQPGTADQARYEDVDWVKTRKPAGKFTPFAVLKHGEWYEQASMGWFGICAQQMDDAAWEEEVSRLLADVPADELVSVFDCHI